MNVVVELVALMIVGGALGIGLFALMRVICVLGSHNDSSLDKPEKGRVTITTKKHPHHSDRFWASVKVDGWFEARASGATRVEAAVKARANYLQKLAQSKSAETAEWAIKKLEPTEEERKARAMRHMECVQELCEETSEWKFRNVRDD